MLKARMCLRSPSVPWREWWVAFRNHETKIEEVRRLAPEAPEDMVRTFLSFRERCMYADVGKAGDPLTPRGLIDPGGLEARFLAAWANTVDAEVRETLTQLAAAKPAPPDRKRRR